MTELLQKYYTQFEWLNLALRWMHVFAGIMWVGATYYFTWLDRRFHTTDPDEVWMVHSGGFYRVTKTKTPSSAHTLHWFKWEAALTWLSGIPLLILVYYIGGLLVDSPEKFTTAAIVGIATIFVGYKIYDVLWLSPLSKNEPAAIVVSFALLMAVSWALPQFMTPRAAWLHVGALLGTIMAANVWERILPAQRKMVAAMREGREPDPLLAERAKFRSKHNTYIVIPVTLIMLSNHFPIATRGYEWWMLGIFTIIGWVVAHVIRKQ